MRLCIPDRSCLVRERVKSSQLFNAGGLYCHRLSMMKFRNERGFYFVSPDVAVKREGVDEGFNFTLLHATAKWLDAGDATPVIPKLLTPAEPSCRHWSCVSMHTRLNRHSSEPVRLQTCSHAVVWDLYTLHVPESVITSTLLRGGLKQCSNIQETR